MKIERTYNNCSLAINNFALLLINHLLIIVAEGSVPASLACSAKLLIHNVGRQDRVHNCS